MYLKYIKGNKVNIYINNKKWKNVWLMLHGLYISILQNKSCY